MPFIIKVGINIRQFRPHTFTACGAPAQLQTAAERARPKSADNDGLHCATSCECVLRQAMSVSDQSNHLCNR